MAFVCMMVIFYVFEFVVGRWLYVNRGEAMDSGRYTVRKLLPWTIGYLLTAIMICDIHYSSVAAHGALLTWLFYIAFFVTMSTFYRFYLNLTKNYWIYSNDRLTQGAPSLKGWCKERKERIKVFNEFYEKPDIALDIDICGYFGGAMFIMTIFVMFVVI